jgi:5-methylcytosine-specific restriction endonuclease McrA
VVGPVKRTALKPNPEKVREWREKQRAWQRKPTALKRSAQKRRTSHTAARSEAFRRSRGRCIVCGARAVHGHHVLPVEKWPELTARAENIVALCHRCHVRHHSAMNRIRWDELPACTILLAQTTSGAAAVYLERTYPR